MEDHSIAKQPVTNVQELIAKIDMMIDGAHQWAAVDSDDELGDLLSVRAHELHADIDSVLIPDEFYPVIGARLDSLKEAARQGRIKRLNAQFALDFVG